MAMNLRSPVTDFAMIVRVMAETCDRSDALKRIGNTMPRAESGRGCGVRRLAASHQEGADRMKHFLIGALSLWLGLGSLSGIASAQAPSTLTTNAAGANLSSRAGVNPTALAQEVPASPAETESLPQGTTQNVTAVDGDAATLGNGGASASPGTVTRPGGTTTLGPNGSYVVSDAPSNVTITGDTDVIAPLDESSNANLAPDAGHAYSCGAYGDWYEAQVAYENAGATAGDPAMVQAMDPDYDGIACEEGMA